uniref:Uncharacterized protein n=1 Tax=Timema genevievae TaxID=629358 RepID=A0A7R9PM95_TIMGE|nr:unnamed protein product [Timema genevievae]
MSFALRGPGPVWCVVVGSGGRGGDIGPAALKLITPQAVSKGVAENKTPLEKRYMFTSSREDYSIYSSPMASLVLIDSSQLTSDSQQMRRENLLFLLLAALAVTGSPDGEDDIGKNRQGRDSYLEAYEDSHGSGPPSEVVFPTPEHEDHHESPSYYTPSSPPPYNGPKYMAPAPAHSYGPPVASSYGPPISPSYPVYGPPPSSVYGAPHSAPSNGFNLMGLDIHTILKILLKITIFKLIVKFITILCLLLFIPKFDMGSNTSTPMDEERRGYGVGRGGSEDSINALTHLVLNAIESNSTLNTATESTANCQDSLYCNLGKAAKIVDSKTSFTGVPGYEPTAPWSSGQCTWLRAYSPVV